MDGVNIIDLFLKAGIVVQLIILGLLIFSIISWTIIIQSSRSLRETERMFKTFQTKYNASSNLMNLFRELDVSRKRLKGIGLILYSGFEDYLQRRALHRGDLNGMLDQVKGNMLNQMSQQLDQLEKGIPFLGTVSSVSPYIGLFGTVWGIMNAFIALGQVKQATLQMVAPGIAEALIATAMGLFAAIPALLAYNRLNGKLAHIENGYSQYIDKFVDDLYKQGLGKE